MNILKQLDDYLASFFMLAIVIITVGAVFMRYIMQDPLQWIEEVLIALYLWAIMLGAASAMRHRGHVSIDAFTSLLSARAQRIIQRINDIISIVVLTTFGYLGLRLAQEAGDKITPILGLKYQYIDLAVPLGAFWMAIYLVLHLLASLQTKQGDA